MWISCWHLEKPIFKWPHLSTGTNLLRTGEGLTDVANAPTYEPPDSPLGRCPSDEISLDWTSLESPDNFQEEERWPAQKRFAFASFRGSFAFILELLSRAPLIFQIIFSFFVQTLI